MMMDVDASHTDQAQTSRTTFQATLGHEFQEPALLEAALTHRSYRFERLSGQDNQRLEFLGDAVLGFLLADRVFRGDVEHPEGRMTVLRASVASGTSLAAKARQIGLGSVLLLGNGERLTGGADRESNLADAFEAILGAIYLDGGIDAVSTVFDRLFAAELAALHADDDPWLDNPKGHLQSIAQKHYHVDPMYETLEETGPRHSSQFHVRVSVGTEFQEEGHGSTKRAAQSAAAEALLKRLVIP